MDSATFGALALKTEARPAALGMNRGVTLRLLTVLVCAADLADTFKRGVFYGKGLNSEKLKAELVSLHSAASQLSDCIDRLGVPEDAPTSLTEPNLRLLHGAVGIFGEAGEMIDALIRQMVEGQLDLINFGEETGDVDWYKALIHDETGLDEPTVRNMVIAKLKKRYGEKFDQEAAAQRDTDAERSAMEQAANEANFDQATTDLAGA